MHRIQIKSIRLVRAEGPRAECGPTKIAPANPTRTGLDAMADAQAQLRRWADTAPAKGGYDKCDFTIEFGDGSLYEGRYDLKHWSCERVDLPGHIRGHLEYYSGRFCPSWLKSKPRGEARYLESVSDVSEVERNRCLAFIAYYEFGQGAQAPIEAALLIAETPRHVILMTPDAGLEVAAKSDASTSVRLAPDRAAHAYAALLAEPAAGETFEAALEARCDAMLPPTPRATPISMP